MGRGRRSISAPAAIILLLSALVGAYYGTKASDPKAPTAESQPSVTGAGLTVVHIVDGDTARLSDGQTVRYLGIDTPEKGEPLYPEAAKLNASLVMNKTIRLEFGKEPKDSYNRTLAWVFTSDEKLANEVMVREGMARVYLHPGNDQYKERLIAAQRDARRANRGIWSQLKPADESFYIGGTGTSARYKFHRPTCEEAKGMKNVVRFDSRDKAYEEGRSPCRTCKP